MVTLFFQLVFLFNLSSCRNFGCDNVSKKENPNDDFDNDGNSIISGTLT